MTNEDDKELHDKIKELTSERNKYHAELVDLQINTMRLAIADHEARLRPVEDAVTKFNFILYLSMGGGLVSLINLSALLFLIVNEKP